MTTRDPFDYVNRTYGLKLTRNCAVRDIRTGRRGQVRCPVRTQEHYIEIVWDGAPKPHGPYHPTEGLEYPENTPQRPQDESGAPKTPPEAAETATGKHGGACPTCVAILNTGELTWGGWAEKSRRIKEHLAEGLPRPCPRCEAPGDCCEAAKERMATGSSLAALTGRQTDLLAFQGTQLAEIIAAAPELERIRVRHCLTELGIKTMNIGAPGSVAREAQEDIANLVNALWRIQQVARRKP